MPHSAGGGSHSGGHHSSSHHSSHSSSHSYSSGRSYSSRSIRSSRTYFPGSRKYVYYKNNKPNYYYSTATEPPSRADAISSLIMMLLFLSPFIGVSVFLAFELFSTGRSISLPSDNKIVIEDNLDVMTYQEEENLRLTLEDFKNKTGVVPAVITDSNDLWEFYDSPEQYAYDLYINRFDDEKHWLVLYTSDQKQSIYSNATFDDWHVENMAGDDITPVISSKTEDYLSEQITSNLTARSKYTVSEAIGRSFTDAYSYLKKPHFDSELLMFFLMWTGFVSIFVAISIGNAIQELKYSKAVRCPSGSKEVTCSNCGKIYVQGIHTTCPHCGAAVASENAINNTETDGEIIRKLIKEPYVNIVSVIPITLFTIIWAGSISRIFTNGNFYPLNLVFVFPIALFLFIIFRQLSPFFWKMYIKNTGEDVTGKINKINTVSSDIAIYVDFKDGNHIKYIKHADKNTDITTINENYKSGSYLNFKKSGDKYLLIEDRY